MTDLGNRRLRKTDQKLTDLSGQISNCRTVWNIPTWKVLIGKGTASKRPTGNAATWRTCLLIMDRNGKAWPVIDRLDRDRLERTKFILKTWKEPTWKDRLERYQLEKDLLKRTDWKWTVLKRTELLRDRLKRDRLEKDLNEGSTWNELNWLKFFRSFHWWKSKIYTYVHTVLQYSNFIIEFLIGNEQCRNTVIRSSQCDPQWCFGVENHVALPF